MKVFKGSFVLLIMLAVAVPMLFLAGCTIGGMSEPPTPTPIPLPTEPDKPVYRVTRGTLIDTAEVLGRVVPSLREDLYFESAGRVITVNVRLWDEVKRGTILAELETGTLLDQLQKARNSLEIAKLRFGEAQANATKVRENNERALQKALLTLEQRKLQLKDAQLRLEQAKLTSEDKLEVLTEQLEKAKVNLATSQLKLAQAREASKEAARKREQDLIIAKNSLEKARSELEEAQAAYDRVAWRPEIGLLAQSRTLRDKTLAYEIALANYNKLLEQPTRDYNLETLENSYKLAELDVKLLEEDIKRLRSGGKEAKPDYSLELAANAVELAKQNVQLTQLEVEQLQATLKETTDYNLEVLKRNVNTAQVEADRLQANVQAAQIIAPFDGKVMEVQIAVGDNIKAYDPLVTIADPRGVEVSAEVLSTDLMFVSVGNPVTISRLIAMEEAYPGRVLRLPESGTTKSVTRRRDTSTYFSIEDPKAKPEAGEVVKVLLQLQRRDNVLIIPSDALRSIRNKFYVQVWEAGRKRLKEIEIGISTKEGIEVKSGLQEGEEVLGH